MFYIVILFGNKFSTNNIEIKSYSNELIFFIKRIIENIVNVTDITITNTNNKYCIKINDVQNNLKIIKFMSHLKRDMMNKVLVTDILKYIFISCGHLLDPKCKYYLDFSNKNESIILNLQKRLAKLNFCFKYKKVDQRHMIYTMNSGEIEDFFTYIGVPQVAIEIMKIKIYKDMRSNVNRIVNCETSNINKIITTAAMQIKHINNIVKKKGIDYLNDELKEIALKRLENPEMSASELMESLSFTMSKTAFRDRMKKIEEISQSLGMR